MKASELKSKSINELKNLIREKRERVDELKFMLRQKKTKNVKELAAVKKDIARILTVMKILSS